MSLEGSALLSELKQLFARAGIKVTADEGGALHKRGKGGDQDDDEVRAIPHPSPTLTKILPEPQIQPRRNLNPTLTFFCDPSP